jgi:hypothetical protein
MTDKNREPSRHEHERGAPLVDDCDNWCKGKYSKWSAAREGGGMTIQKYDQWGRRISGDQEATFAYWPDHLSALAEKDREIAYNQGCYDDAVGEYCLEEQDLRKQIAALQATIAEKESLAHDRGVIIDSQLGQIAALEEREEDLVRNCARANAEKDILQTERDKWKAKCTCIVPDDYDADYANKIFGDRYGYDWEYRGVTTLKATIAEKEDTLAVVRDGRKRAEDLVEKQFEHIAALQAEAAEEKIKWGKQLSATKSMLVESFHLLKEALHHFDSQEALIKSLTEALETPCPWPDDIWSMTDDEYVATIPDPTTRTAVSGYLMRYAWELFREKAKATLGGKK